MGTRARWVSHYVIRRQVIMSVCRVKGTNEGRCRGKNECWIIVAKLELVMAALSYIRIVMRCALGLRSTDGKGHL